jgi:HAD superfamily hydrolase (TIGR01509 family)
VEQFASLALRVRGIWPEAHATNDTGETGEGRTQFSDLVEHEIMLRVSAGIRRQRNLNIRSIHRDSLPSVDQAMQDVELVIFDCDGTLVDSERLAVRVDSRLITELGWPLTPQDIAERFVGHSREYMREQIEEHLGRTLPDDWQRPFEQAYWTLVDAELQPVPGVRDVLDWLSVPFCVASNGSHEKMTKSLSVTGLLPCFTNRMFSADDVGRPKPDPALYLYAAAHMGARPEACAVVDDSVFGIEAARRAGMRSFGYAGSVTPGARLAGPGTTVFSDMSELPRLLTASASS